MISLSYNDNNFVVLRDSFKNIKRRSKVEVETQILINENIIDNLVNKTCDFLSKEYDEVIKINKELNIIKLKGGKSICFHVYW